MTLRPSRMDPSKCFIMAAMMRLVGMIGYAVWGWSLGHSGAWWDFPLTCVGLGVGIAGIALLELYTRVGYRRQAQQSQVRVEGSVIVS